MSSVLHKNNEDERLAALRGDSVKGIAATAWAKNLPLITTNVRHFVPIQELEMFTFYPTEQEIE